MQYEILQHLDFVDSRFSLSWLMQPAELKVDHVNKISPVTSPFSIAFIHSWQSSLPDACKIRGCLKGPVIFNEVSSSGILSTASMAARGNLPLSFSWFE